MYAVAAGGSREADVARRHAEGLLESLALSHALAIAAHVVTDPVPQALVLAGRIDEARTRLDTTEEQARLADSPWALSNVAWLRSVILSDEGELLTAEAAAHGSIAHAWDHGADVVVRWGLMALAIAVAASEDHAGVARLLGILDRFDDETGARFRFPALAQRLDAATERAVTALGADAYEEHLAEGSALVLPDAIAYLRRTRGERRRPTHGWDSLTPTELRVVELVQAHRPRHRTRSAAGGVNAPPER